MRKVGKFTESVSRILEAPRNLQFAIRNKLQLVNKLHIGTLYDFYGSDATMGDDNDPKKPLYINDLVANADGAIIAKVAFEYVYADDNFVCDIYLSDMDSGKFPYALVNANVELSKSVKFSIMDLNKYNKEFNNKYDFVLEALNKMNMPTERQLEELE